ncbi:MAG: twin-arginine translocation signal domain-containing protein [Candidatus Paceibacterota bacterium]
MKELKRPIEINRRSFLTKAGLGTATTVIWPFFSSCENHIKKEKIIFIIKTIPHG